MTKVEPTSPATKKTYADIVTDLGADDSTMFGMPTMKADGKAFCGIFGDALVFKLTGDDHARALKLAGAKLFDPSGMGRAMKEWVVVPKKGAVKEWPKLAAAALAYVASAPAKKKAAAKPKRAAKKAVAR